jgi:hypothetical protein
MNLTARLANISTYVDKTLLKDLIFLRSSPTLRSCDEENPGAFL